MPEIKSGQALILTGQKVSLAIMKAPATFDDAARKSLNKFGDFDGASAPSARA
jgi:hypothetical protein